MANISLSRTQEQAVESIEKWFKGKQKQTYFLSGYAGTGKTTLVNYVIEKLGIKLDEVAFACYTGKAALVVTQKAQGRYKASTIHSLIYKVYTDNNGEIKVTKKAKSMLQDLKLIVIDEASMVDGQIMKDLKSFGIKILFIGDTGQLPPVSQNGNEEFLKMFNNPDFQLTDIHRQAAENPIIKLSMLARTKQEIEPGVYGKDGEAVVITHATWENIKDRLYKKADQIICGYNRTRKQLNSEIREVLGFTGDVPLNGDKMICLNNDWNKSIDDVSLVNGMTGYVKKVYKSEEIKEKFTHEATTIDFRPDFSEESYFREITIPNKLLTDPTFKLLPYEHKVYNSFDFGYAITCHKSQGSQWKNVVVLNEVLNKDTHHRWLYTAITRSSERLVLVI
ncbi:ATP-dependent RecD-like DNA helicase [Bacillus vallismortis]|uniref:ATP-dependent RecD-like DNA helicase n=1 Tax=Bacillus vallismortis TaxID=72361 RepID=A0AAP3CNH8_BACVA|nr:ATP-dependent RecD-like DNA helicase [Bacillus vallismortis]MCY8318280.1 ATP-dependent RecD-like DNA helicase [Bacillus vallismortis]